MARGQSLYDWCQENGEFGQQLLQEWTGLDEHDNPIKINEVSYGSGKKVQWQCVKGHIWTATISHRTNLMTKCPYCDNLERSERAKKIRVKQGINDFNTWCNKNGEWGQRLLQEWTGLDENNNPIDINNIAKASNEKVIWKCKEGHTWISIIASRTSRKIGCPYCSGIRATEKNSLKTWCQTTKEYGQQLLQEWTGLDENNNPIDIHKISYGSNKKVHWKCKEGHTWIVKICTRTIGKTNCPECAKLNSSQVNRKSRLNNRNILSIWCQTSGEYGQQLLSEWTGLDENNNPIELDEVSYGSNKRVQWKCSKGHIWTAMVSNRIKKMGCPYCSGRRVTEKNSLTAWCNTNSEYGQQLLQEWIGIDENNNPIDINDMTYGSTKQVQWQCVKGHTWTATINHRTNRKIGCPYCYASKAAEKCSFLKWCQENREWGQRLLQEWTGSDEQNKPVELDEVSYGSEKKMHWKCSRGHTWITAIYSRTSQKTGCPYCIPYNTSFPEQFIYHSLKQLFPNIIHRGKYKVYEYDITIP